MTLKVAFVGAGNVAWHLAPALDNVGVKVNYIHSRNPKTGNLLVTRLYEGEFLYYPDFEDKNIDILFLCVPDDALENIVDELIIDQETIVVHTSGSQSIGILSYRFNKAGVFYPLQTFSKAKRVDFKTVPILIEGSDRSTENLLVGLANKLSNNIIKAGSEERKSVHLAAVFACNFSNHMLFLAEKILKEKKYDLQILYPLISETINKALEVGPSTAQTGPARRHDVKILDKHMSMLESNSDLSEIYRLISQHILDTYNH